MYVCMYVAVPWSLLNAREKLRVQVVAICFGFPSRWLINSRDIFKPVTKCSKCNWTDYETLETR